MISVCIPTFNGERFINRQIDSILMQIGPHDEIIISDDSSTDRTIDIIKSYNDARIKLLENCKFRSPVYNLENALKLAKGDYIFLADQDDVWNENKVQITLEYFNKYNVIISDCNLINEEDVEIHPSFFDLNRSKSGFVHNFIKNSYLGCCIAFDRKILWSILPFPGNIAMHDIWIGLIAELTGKPFFLSEKLVSYRRHSLNFTPTSKKSRFSIWYKIFYRLQFIFYAFIRYIKIKLHESQHYNRYI